MSRTTKISKCKNCGKEYHAWSFRLGIYCSLKCQHEFYTKKKIVRWLVGEINPMNTNGLLRPWGRKYLFGINKNKCSMCGWGEINPFTSKIPLEVDHIDGNFRNNKLENLRLLCPNCHSLTGTYKNLNKGKGRTGRN